MPKADDDALKEIALQRIKKILKDDIGWATVFDKQITDAMETKFEQDWFQTIITRQFEKFVKKILQKEDYDKDTFIELGAKAYLEERGFRVNKKPK